MQHLWTGGYHVNSNWIEAVNLIVVQKKKKLQKSNTKPTDYYDYEVATIEREGIPFVSVDEDVLEETRSATNKRRHLPSASLHEADFAVEWRPVIGHSVVKQFEAMEIKNKTSKTNIPPMFTTEESITWKSARASSANSVHLLPPQLALRICALRTLLLELGVLLVIRNKSSNKENEQVSQDLVSHWRSLVAKDESAFLRFFQENPSLRPRLDYDSESQCLFEWWNWLTPTTVGRSPRYDTLFYLIVLDDHIPTNSISVEDSTNPSRIIWNSPDDLLSQYSTQSFLLSPTQLYELLRVSSHPWTDWLREFARKRESCGIRRWIPLPALYSDGTISFLPGDQFYPEKVDLLPTKNARMYSGLSTDEMRKKTQKRINRLEHNGYWCRVVVTVEDDAVVPNLDMMTGGDNCGHLSIFYHQLPVNRISANGENVDEQRRLSAKL